MKRTKKGFDATAKGATLEERVKKAVRMTWGVIIADVDWPVTLDEAVELALDADRPVDNGFLSREDYDEMMKLDNDVTDRWGREALRGLV